MPKRTLHTRDNPLVIIENRAKKYLTDEEVASLIPALQRQVDEHFRPAWGVGATLQFKDWKKKKIPSEAYKIIVFNQAKSPDDAGYFGYHWQRNGYPVASIFADVDLRDDKTISETLSHEILEMLVDPALNLYAYRPGKGWRRDRGYFYEVCDAVQCAHYHIDGVKVCDFVYPEWFEHVWPARSRKFDHLGLLQSPFQLLPKCYADVREVGRGWLTIWGKNATKQRRRHRQEARKTHNF